MECEVVNMKELLTYIVANLVTVPDAISIEEKENGDDSFLDDGQAVNAERAERQTP